MILFAFVETIFRFSWKGGAEEIYMLCQLTHQGWTYGWLEACRFLFLFVTEAREELTICSAVTISSCVDLYFQLVSTLCPSARRATVG